MKAESQPGRSTFIPVTQAVTVLLLVVVEVCWVSLWYYTLLRSYNFPSPRTEIILGGLMLAAYLLALLLHTWRLLKAVGRIVLYSGLAIGLLLGAHWLLSPLNISIWEGIGQLEPIVVITILFELWLVWRGITLARDQIQPRMAWNRFELGLFFILANMLIINRLGPGIVGWNLFVIYIFVGFAAVIMSRVSYAGLIHGLKVNPFDKHWINITFGLLAGVILISAFVAALLTSQFSGFLAGLVVALRWIGQAVLIMILLPGAILSFLFLYVVQPLVPWLEKLFDFQGFQGQGPNLEMALPDPEIGSRFLTGAWPEIIRGFLFWGVVLILVVLIVKYFRKKQTRRRNKALESESESLLEQGEARLLVLKVLQDAMQALSGRFSLPNKPQPTANIRRIYTQLLALSADLGLTRYASQTPAEYLPIIQRGYATLDSELECITQAYQDVRYGEMVESPVQQETSELAWLKIESEGKRLKTIKQVLEKKAEERPSLQ